MSDPTPAAPGRPPASAGPALPTAVLRPQRRVSLAWIVPLLALVLAGWLGYRAWSARGLIIAVHLDDGHGLKPGDAVRFRGITVGEVRRLQLSGTLEEVEVTVSLDRQADHLARAGSRFWVVRPRLGVGEIAGLETLIGPRYLAVLPGDGPRQFRFVGLSTPPVVDSVEPGDLEIVLEASRRGDLRAGAPVLYRQVRVGTVLSVGLTSDAGAVEARLHVDKPYAELIRPRTRFWRVGGLDASVGLTGISIQVDSLQTLVAGGVALATPPEGGPMVHTGHRFALDDEPDESWVEWAPMVVIGSDLLPPGAPMPDPLRATIGWRQGWLFKGQKSRQGWVLPTEAGLLGPADLLRADSDADAESVALEVGGEEVPVGGEPRWTDGRLALLDHSMGTGAWPRSRLRRAVEPEDCLAVGDRTAPPLPIDSSRLAPGEGGWTVDVAVTVDPTWHGACVVARADGRLVGLLLVDHDEGSATVALLPENP